MLSWVRFGAWLYRFLIFASFWTTYIMSWHPSKIVYFWECYPQSLDIQISIPALSITTTLVSELSIIRVWLLVKEACIMWTNIWVPASSDCIRITYPYCKLQTIPSLHVTKFIICALVWASILLTARNPKSLAFAIITSKEVVPWIERSDITSCSFFLQCLTFQMVLVIYTKCKIISGVFSSILLSMRYNHLSGITIRHFAALDFFA